MERGDSSEWKALRSQALQAEEENSVLYRIFLLGATAASSKACTLRSSLAAYTALLDHVRSFVASATKDYIWHVDAFTLSLECLAKSGHYCLQGRAAFAENIEDEWLIVWLLREISSRWPDTACTVTDNDGELLLIEGAHALPAWLEPQTSAHRVFIHRGAVHIVPPELLPPEKICLSAALGALKREPEVCRESALLQRAVWGRRVEVQPGRARELNEYTVRCILPQRCARVLQRAPWLITPIARAFLYRDEGDAKVLREMPRIGLRRASFVQRRVRFTKCAYAQVASTQFIPTRAFHAANGGRYHESMRTLLEALEKGEEVEVNSISRDERALLIGFKVACGMELLLSGEKWDKSRGSSREKEDTMKRAMLAARQLTEHKEVVEEYLSHCLLNEDILALSQKGGKEEMEESWEAAGVDTTPLEENGAESMKDPDESWMHVEASQVERLVHGSQEEKVEGLFDNVDSFLHKESQFDGARSEEQVDFDVDKFMSILATAGSPAEESDREDDDDNNSQDSQEIELGFFETVQLMDDELQRQNAIGSTVTRVDPSVDHPLDLNFTVVKNLIQSLESQEGNPGPVSNLLGHIGTEESTGGDA